MASSWQSPPRPSSTIPVTYGSVGYWSVNLPTSLGQPRNGMRITVHGAAGASAAGGARHRRCGLRCPIATRVWRGWPRLRERLVESHRRVQTTHIAASACAWPAAIHLQSGHFAESETWKYEASPTPISVRPRAQQHARYCRWRGRWPAAPIPCGFCASGGWRRNWPRHASCGRSRSSPSRFHVGIASIAIWNGWAQRSPCSASRRHAAASRSHRVESASCALVANATGHPGARGLRGSRSHTASSRSKKSR